MYKLKKFLLYFILFFAFCLICFGISKVKADTVVNIGYDPNVQEIISNNQEIFDNARQLLLDTERITESDILVTSGLLINLDNPFTIGKVSQDIQLNSSNTSVYFSNSWCISYDEITKEVSMYSGYCYYNPGINLITPEYVGFQYWYGGNSDTTLTITNNVSGYSYILNENQANIQLEYNVSMNLYTFVNTLNGVSNTPPYVCSQMSQLGSISNYSNLVLKVSGTTDENNPSLYGYFDIIPNHRIVNLDTSIFDINSLGDENNLEMNPYDVDYNLSVQENDLYGQFYRLRYTITSIDNDLNNISHLFFMDFVSNLSSNPSYQALMNGTILLTCSQENSFSITSYGYTNSSGGTVSTDPVISNYLQDNNPISDLNFLQKLKTIFPAGPVDSILNLPLVMLNSIKSSFESTCQPLVITLPYVNKNLTLNCQNTFYSNIGMTNFFNTVGTIASTVILMNYFIFLYNWVDDVLKLSDSKIKMWGTGEVK